MEDRRVKVKTDRENRLLKLRIKEGKNSILIDFRRKRGKLSLRDLPADALRTSDDALQITIRIADLTLRLDVPVTAGRNRLVLGPTTGDVVPQLDPCDL